MKKLIILSFLLSTSAVIADSQSQKKELKLNSFSQNEFDSCKHLAAFRGLSPKSEAEFKMQYDTLRHYIESCTTDLAAHFAFSVMDGDVQNIETNDTSRFTRYREWLLSVVYLNTADPYYFCACVLSIANSFIDPGGSKGINNRLAVLNFLAQDSTCNDEILQEEIKQGIGIRHARWLNGDTTKPEDTTLPSLDELGLGILIHHSGVTTPTTPLPSIYLISFTSNPNPFIKETTIEFELNRMAYIVLTVYDELGRIVWGDGKGMSLEAGRHIFTLNGSSLPRGTLYARISTGFGEVKTLKLVHQ